jgi:hypothetical protein
VAVAHVRSDTLTGDPHTTLLDSTVGQGVAEVRTERSTTERWPISTRGRGSLPSARRSHGRGRASRFGEDRKPRAETPQHREDATTLTLC